MWLKYANNYNSGAAQTWEAALSGCEWFSYAGYSDWRLPNVRELKSIVDAGKEYPAINTTYFRDTKIDGYWTSTIYVHGTSHAWFVDFGTGYACGYSKPSFTTMSVRCAVAREYGSFDNLVIFDF